MTRLLFLCLCSSFLFSADYILSIPRTGTNWVVSSLQILTHCPVHFLEQPPGSNTFGENRLGLADFSKEVRYRTHDDKRLRSINSSENNLILIVRDYKERLLRGGKGRMNPNQKLMRNLELFDRWDPDHRFLIYYEDMVERPAIVMEELLAFLGESLERLDDYAENLEEYRDRVLKSYHKQHRTADINKLGRRGRDVRYYTKKVSKNRLREIDGQMKDINSNLWKKYLSRYAL